MRWLIIEDSLESAKGHWFEYLEGFCRQLPDLGDEVTLLVSHRAEEFIRRELGAQPVLPESAFGKMSDGASGWRRLARIPVHAWKTVRSVKRFLKTRPQPDVVFVPTVIVHHLLAWFWLVKTVLRRQPTRLLLFFPGLPILWLESNATPTLDGALTAKLTQFLLQRLATEIKNGKVILGIETEAMKETAEKVFGVPFTYFPHPVQPAALTINTPDSLTMACYGPARHEKGSDVLVKAIEEHLKRFPDSQTQFVVQWLDDFSLPDGKTAVVPAVLKQHPRVKIINRFFDEGEYVNWLAKTNVMLLPYRFSSYGLRVSRVVIEAIIYGIPTIATESTTLAEQAGRCGVATLCQDGDVESLISAIETVEKDFRLLQARAEEQKPVAREHFSVREFRRGVVK